jgi:membrane-associated phospholipid phosphatase
MLLLFVLGFGWVTAAVLLSGPLVTLDHVLVSWSRHALDEDLVRVIRRFVVLPGQRLYDVPPMAVLAAVLAWRRRQWRPLLVPLAVMVLLAIVVPGVKILTGRTNPDSGMDVLFAGGSEYPSGHEVNAIVVWGMTFALASRLDWAVGRWLTPRRRAALVTVMALDVGIGVVVARTHWLSDVLASLFLAIPLLWVILQVGFTGAETGDAGPEPGPERAEAAATVGATRSPEESESDGCPAG